jgi:hypothetical protein
VTLLVKPRPREFKMLFNEREIFKYSLCFHFSLFFSFFSTCVSGEKLCPGFQMKTRRAKATLPDPMIQCLECRVLTCPTRRYHEV